MRRLIWVAILLPTFAGCTWADAIFAAFGNYYGDGATPAERQFNYYDKVEESRRMSNVDGKK